MEIYNISEWIIDPSVSVKRIVMPNIYRRCTDNKVIGLLLIIVGWVKGVKKHIV